ncbi:MAG: CPBP family intramembrane glutamic endopeptidase, partial [Myxococcota bacterium]
GSLTRLTGNPTGAIMASSALFAVGHLFISLPFAVMSFGGGLFFGAVYARHRTLIGVCVLHFLLHTTIKLMGFL